jgi:hypothetical protein
MRIQIENGAPAAADAARKGRLVTKRRRKITFAEMRSSGVRGPLIFRSSWNPEKKRNQSHPQREAVIRWTAGDPRIVLFTINMEDFTRKGQKPTSLERAETNTLSVGAHPRDWESVEAKGMPEVK